MKKSALAALVIIMLCFMSVQARASDLSELSSEGDKYKSAFTEILPDLAYDKIADKLAEDDVSSLVSADYLAALVFDSFSGQCGTMGRSFCTLLAFVIFFALLSFFRESLGQETFESAEGMLLVVTALSTFRLFSGSVEMAFSYISEAREFSSSLIPITSGLYLLGGNTATAVTASAGAGAALLCVESLCGVALPLLVRVSLALTVVGSISSNASYGMVCKNVRGAYIGVLGFFTMILFASLSFGNLISSAQDSVAARAVKYALGNMIPIVGSTVTSAYGTLSASVTLIKSTLGVSALVAMLIITLPVIVNLLLVRLVLNLCADLAVMLNCARIGRLYSDFRAVYDLALAAVVFVAVVFVIIVSAFLKCANAIA